MSPDASEGWDGIADQFQAARSSIGAGLVRAWARTHLPPGGAVVDIGCGSGVPIAEVLIDEGFELSGIDASPRMIAAFRQRFPEAPSLCEPAQDSAFFHRRFDAAVAIGLLFLLTEDDQRKLIGRIGNALKARGRLLFSAPREICEWRDLLTGRNSRSLGVAEYALLLSTAGLRLAGCSADEGANNYYDAVKEP